VGYDWELHTEVLRAVSFVSDSLISRAFVGSTLTTIVSDNVPTELAFRHPLAWQVVFADLLLLHCSRQHALPVLPPLETHLARSSRLR
jgi:hypothetical protein